MILKNDPVFGSTVFSVVLHLALVLAVLQLPELPSPSGDGLQIELLRTLAAPGQAEADISEQAMPQLPVNGQAHSLQDAMVQQAVVNETGRTIAHTKPQAKPTPHAVSAGADASGADMRTATTGADTQAVAMLELLHDAISDHKHYPYIARRQRREGIARVGFVLHPDGRVDNAALLESSRSRALDRAALDAVAGIAPFEPATLYLSQAQTYRIDVVFRLE